MFSPTGQLDCGGDSTASGVSHDHNHFCTSYGTGVFETAKHFGSDDISGDSSAEDVSEADIKDDFGWGSRVDASENDGQWKLPRGSFSDLIVQIPNQSLSGPESRVSSQEDFEHFVGRESLLEFPGGVLGVKNMIFDSHLLLEADHTDFDLACRTGDFSKLAKQSENIRIDEIRFFRVEYQMRSARGGV